MYIDYRPICPFLRYRVSFFDFIRDLGDGLYCPLSCCFVCLYWYSVISICLSVGYVPYFFVNILLCMIGLARFLFLAPLVSSGQAILLAYFSQVILYFHCVYFPFLVFMCSILGLRWVLSFLKHSFARSPHLCSVTCSPWHSVPPCFLTATLLAVLPILSLIWKPHIGCMPFRPDSFWSFLSASSTFPVFHFPSLLFMVPVSPCFSLWLFLLLSVCT